MVSTGKVSVGSRNDWRTCNTKREGQRVDQNEQADRGNEFYSFGEMNVTEDMEVFDLLVRENEGSEKVENTDWDVERELVALLTTSQSR